MELKALLLVLTGSVFHLGWNVLTKGAKDKLAFLWIAIIPASLVSLLFSLNQFELNSEGLPFLISSMVIHAFYFWSLSTAYKFADLSFVYPYCRGLGALFTTLGGVFLLSESPTLRGGFGIALTLIATFLEPVFSGFKEKKKMEYKGIGFTVITGIAISAYLLVDKVGVTHIKTLIYLPLMLLGSALFLSPIMLKDKRFLEEIKHSTWKPFLGSAFLFAAYFLILLAMETAPISYVVSARASGIIISGFAGILFFKEKVSPIRWLSILIISIGVYFIGTA
ncbi:MAG: EamA family transporter [Bacteriovoracaceae bacterium]|nr:EamA family transporter [Bacteriovoracaceae bacterium]